jgi:hypothetical protein
MVAGMVRVNVVSNESEVKRPPAWENPEAMRPTAVALAVALLVVLDGCAGVACTPAIIVVAEKDERLRLQSEPRGLRTDELGRVKEQRREVIVSEYWVRDPDGRWYRVTRSAWQGVELGQSLRVCR